MLIMGVEAQKRANAEFVESLRRSIRRHQLRLISAPDPQDPWWFLVDPSDYTEEGEPWPDLPSDT